MENVRYVIIDADDNEEYTNDLQKARRAFLNGQFVRIVREAVIYTEDSQSILTVITEMKL